MLPCQIEMELNREYREKAICKEITCKSITILDFQETSPLISPL